ncbi:MAG: hypothetical protein H0V44_17550 [Planctomycetes bacterium]|nr:hypothetical protein [Planctomycetota bacterium]
MDDQPRLTEILRAIGQQSRRPLPSRSFGAEDAFGLHVASTIEMRRRAWAMVYRSYLAKEFAEPNREGLWYGLHDALPSTTTFLVTHRGHDVSTMTVAFDSPVGLPADALYRDELDRLRTQGRRPCEMISLASEGVPFREGTEALKQMFRLAHLSATYLEGATDMIITVNPRHTAFYERTLLFTRIGELRSYAKVGGAPAVLMRIALDTAQARWCEKYGNDPGSMYRFFYGPEQIDDLMAFLRSARQPLDDEDISEYFVQRRPLISSSTIEVHRHLQACYPRLESALPLPLVPA